MFQNIVYLPRLVNLNLVRVAFKSNDSVQYLITGCAVLKFLSIARNTWHDAAMITISSPVLKRLELKPYEESLGFFSPYDFGYKDSKLEIIASVLEHHPVSARLQDCDSQDFVLGSLTSLEEVYVDVSCHSPPEISYWNSVVKLLETLHHVKFLRFSYDTCKALNGATNHLSTTFKRLTTLVVEVYCSKWKFLPMLLENSVNLQVLQLCKPWYLCCQETHNGYWRIPSCLLSSLREIFVRGFTGLEDELAMIRYVLKYGRVLIKMEPDSGLYADDFKKKFQLLQKILMFPRKVIYMCDCIFLRCIDELIITFLLRGDVTKVELSF